MAVHAVMCETVRVPKRVRGSRKIDGDLPINERWFPPKPNRFALGDSTCGINIKHPRALDTARGIVATRVGRLENGNGSCGAARAKTAAVTDLSSVARDKQRSREKKMTGYELATATNEEFAG